MKAGWDVPRGQNVGSFVLGSTKGELQDSGKGPGNTEEKAAIKKTNNILWSTAQLRLFPMGPQDSAQGPHPAKSPSPGLRTPLPPMTFTAAASPCCRCRPGLVCAPAMKQWGCKTLPGSRCLSQRGYGAVKPQECQDRGWSRTGREGGGGGRQNPVVGSWRRGPSFVC